MLAEKVSIPVETQSQTNDAVLLCVVCLTTEGRLVSSFRVVVGGVDGVNDRLAVYHYFYFNVIPNANQWIMFAQFASRPPHHKNDGFWSQAKCMP